MSHRRKGRRFSLTSVAAPYRPGLIGHLPQARRLIARFHRARTPAAINALTDARRWMPRVACRKRAGKVAPD